MSWKHFFVCKPVCLLTLIAFTLALCPPVYAEDPEVELSEEEVDALLEAVNNLSPEDQAELANSLEEGDSEAVAETAEEILDDDKDDDDSNDDVVLAVSIIAGLALLYWLFKARHKTTAQVYDPDNANNLASLSLNEHTSIELESGFLEQSSSRGFSGDQLDAKDMASGKIKLKVEF